MKHLPNLLKQESSSAATLVHILSLMYFDPRPEHQAARPQVAERLLPYVQLTDSCVKSLNTYLFTDLVSVCYKITQNCGLIHRRKTLLPGHLL
jgi:hypothetical protein